MAHGAKAKYRATPRIVFFKEHLQLLFLAWAEETAFGTPNRLSPAYLFVAPPAAIVGKNSLKTEPPGPLRSTHTLPPWSCMIF